MFQTRRCFVVGMIAATSWLILTSSVHAQLITFTFLGQPGLDRLSVVTQAPVTGRVVGGFTFPPATVVTRAVFRDDEKGELPDIPVLETAIWRVPADYFQRSVRLTLSIEETDVTRVYRTFLE